MKGFSGFPDGKMRLTPVPNLFFSDLLPNIDNLAELKVTMYMFWALGQMDRQVPYLRLTDFMQDGILMDGLGSTPTTAVQALYDGLERAQARGSLLHITVEGAEGSIDLYFVNSPKGRAAVDGIEKGEWRPSLGRDQAVSLTIEKPNIFVLYEQNIGALTPIIADELRDAERDYPVKWIEEAIQIAVRNNARKWRYVNSILERWRLEGKHDAVDRRHPPTQRNRQIPEDVRDIIKS